MLEGKDALDAQPFDKIVLYDKYKECDVEVLFSLEDAHAIRQKQWYMSKTGYVVNEDLQSMHLFVWYLRGNTVPDDCTIDHHHYRSPLDNRYGNLKPATRTQQALNRAKSDAATSELHGVSMTEHGTWTAHGVFERSVYYLGTYKTEIEAGVAYDRWIISLPDFHEGFRKPNFPEKVDEHRLMGPPEKRKVNRPFTCVQPLKSGRFEALYRRKAIGVFDDAGDAAYAHDEAAVKHNPRIVYLNFPELFLDFFEARRNKIKFTLTKVENNVGFVWLENVNEFLYIDVEDYERCKTFKLHVAKQRGHPVANLELDDKKGVALGRFILNVQDKSQSVTYRDHNSLNMRKTNLVVVPKNTLSLHTKKREDTTTKKMNIHYRNDRDTYCAQVRVPKHLRKDDRPSSKCVRKSLQTFEEASRWRDLQVMHYYPGQYRELIFDDWDAQTRLYWIQKLHVQF